MCFPANLLAVRLQSECSHSILAPMMDRLPSPVGADGFCLPCRPASTATLRRALRVLGGLALVGTLIALSGGGCEGGLTGNNPDLRNRLDTMDQVTLRIDDQQFRVWLALDDAQRQRGLMQVEADELAPVPNPDDPDGPSLYRGMLFVFPDERPLGFWMANTIIPLDIAYMDALGQIVKIHTMAPMETRTYPSIAPAQYALEVRAGLFAELGVHPGHVAEIPDSILKDVR